MKTFNTEQKENSFGFCNLLHIVKKHIKIWIAHIAAVIASEWQSREGIGEESS